MMLKVQQNTKLKQSFLIELDEQRENMNMLEFLLILKSSFFRFYENFLFHRNCKMNIRHAPRPGISGLVLPGDESVQLS